MAGARVEVTEDGARSPRPLGRVGRVVRLMAAREIDEGERPRCGLVDVVLNAAVADGDAEDPVPERRRDAGVFPCVLAAAVLAPSVEEAIQLARDRFRETWLASGVGWERRITEIKVSVEGEG